VVRDQGLAYPNKETDMARKINWGPTNELMQRWTQYMMQDKLAKNRSERSMAQLREQMSGYEGLEDLRHEHDLYLAGVKNDFAKKAALAEVLMDLDADPDFTALESSERVLRANGQTELADKKKAEYEGKKEALVKAVTQLYSGENLDETPIGSILGAGKFSETSGLLQAGMTRKSGIEQRATTERGQDVTMRGQDVTKRGQDVTLRGQDIGVSGGDKSDYQKRIQTLGLKTIDDLKKQRDDIAPEDYLEDEELGGKTGEINEAMTNIKKLINESATRELTPEELQLVFSGKSPEIAPLGGEIGTVLPRTGTEFPETQPPLQVPTPEPQVEPPITPQSDLQVKFNDVVAILMQKGKMSLEKATALALGQPEFMSLREQR